MNSKEKKLSQFSRLLDIMDELRVKCPWDRKQTMLSLRNQTVEECFELTDAIVRDEPLHIKKELGDLLLHIIFYSKISDELGHFDIADVAESLCEKLIYRHPHVFAAADWIESDKQVEQQWAALKQTEKDGNLSVLSGVPRGMPALPKACRIQQKAASVGFDWQQRADVWNKVREEVDEVQHEIDIDSPNSDLEGEFGDLLFSIINAARLYNVDPELALERTNQKFISRFSHIEHETLKKGLTLQSLNLSQMDELWEQAKTLETQEPTQTTHDKTKTDSK